MKKRISGVVMDGTTGTAVRGTTTISIPEGEHATIEVEVTGQDGVAIDYADYSGCVLTIRAALGDDAPIVARTGSGVGNVLTFEVYGRSLLRRVPPRRRSRGVRHGSRWLGSDARFGRSGRRGDRTGLPVDLGVGDGHCLRHDRGYVSKGVRA